MDLFKEFRMKVYILCYYIIRMFTKVKSNRIMLESYWGKSINCNPKAMLDYMLENNYDDYEYIVVYNGECKADTANIKYVNIRSLKYLYYLATSKYWVLNTHQMATLKPKKNQVYMQTWHGAGAFKKFGLDIIDDRQKEKEAWRRDADHWTYLLCSSEEVKDIYSNAFGVKKEIIHPIGLPRNDCFYDTTKIEKLRKEIDKQINNKENKKIILYAPTFRDNKKFELMFNIEDLYNNLSDEYILLLKLHPNIKDDLIEIDDKYKDFVINFSDYEETQELLMVTDLLITDYSSIIFDFALTSKPIVLYAYDLEEYKNRIRGFYYEYEEFVPGPIVRNQEELIAEIKGYNQLQDRYKEKVENFARKFNHVSDKSASELAVNILLGKNN